VTSAAGKIAGPLPKPGVFEAPSQAFVLIRGHPIQLMAPFAIVYGLTVAERFVFRDLITDSGQLSTEWVLLLAFGQLFLQTLGWAAVIVMVGALARGGAPSLASAFGQVCRKLILLIVLFVLWATTLILASVPGWVTLGVTAAAGASDWLTTVLALAIGLPVFLYLMTRVGLAYPGLMLDEAGPQETIRESWTLTHGHVLRLLWIILVAVVATEALEVGLGQLFGFAGGNARTIGTGIVGIPLDAFSVAALTLFYLHIRYPGAKRGSTAPSQWGPA